jgi:hypothetical protein
MQAAGIKLNGVAYRASNQQMQDLVGGPCDCGQAVAPLALRWRCPGCGRTSIRKLAGSCTRCNSAIYLPTPAARGECPLASPVLLAALCERGLPAGCARLTQGKP